MAKLYEPLNKAVAFMSESKLKLSRPLAAAWAKCALYAERAGIDVHGAFVKLSSNMTGLGMTDEVMVSVVAECVPTLMFQILQSEIDDVRFGEREWPEKKA